MISKKTIITVSILAVLIIPLIATSAKIFGKSGYKEEEGEKSLSLQIYYNGNEKVAEAWREICFDFEDETEAMGDTILVNPHIGKTINTDMKNDWNNDNPPDFLWIAGNGIGETGLVKNDKFLDLTEWYETAKVFGENYPVKQAINKNLIYTYEGDKHYEMPVLSLVHGLYYDKNYMDSKEYDIPKNYDEIVKLAQETSIIDQAMLTYPGKYASYLLWSYIMPAVAAYDDTEFFDKVCSAKDPNVYDDERFKDVLNRFLDFVKCADDSFYIGSSTQDHTAAQRAWLNHSALAIGNGMWLESEVKDSLDEDKNFKMYFSNSPLIKKDQKNTALIIPNNCAVAKYGKHKESALTFLTYLYRDDVQQKLAEAYSYLPAINDPEYETYTLTETTKQTYDAINNSELVVYKHTDWGTVGDIFNDCINTLVDKSATIDDVIRRLKDEAGKQ